MTHPFRATQDVIIRTPRFEDAVRFYETVLGLPMVHKSPSLAAFDAGAIRLYVEHGPEHGPVFDFRVPNMVGAKRRLLSAGCTVQEEDPAVPRCYIRDPHGVVFNIEQAAESRCSPEP